MLGKNIIMYSRDHMSSRRESSLDRCELMEAYRAVPRNPALSLAVRISPLGSTYRLASPKSIR